MARVRVTPEALVAAVEAEVRFLNSPSVDLATAIDNLEEGLGAMSASGISVTPDKALKYIALYSGVRYLAESIGSLPFPLYRREGRSRIRVHADEDYRAHLIDEEPNPWQTAETFWSTIIGHANLWGNGYSLVEFDKHGDAEALWLLDPRAILPQRDSKGVLRYVSTIEGKLVAYERHEIIHVRAFGTGDVGISPIGVARQAIGEQLAAEEYAANFWLNDASPGGVISYDKKLSDAQHAEAVRRWSSMHQGLRRKHLMAVLDNGAEFHSVGVPQRDAQFLESRKWGVRQIASLLRVPPHKIGDLEGNVTFASIDAQNIDAIQDSLRPWVVRIEQAVKRTIFPPFVGARQPSLDGRKRLYPQFNLNGLLRGDVKSRTAYYIAGRRNGWLSADDVREMEDMSEIGPGKGGDIYLQESTLVPLGTEPSAAAPPPDEPEDAPDEDDAPDEGDEEEKDEDERDDDAPAIGPPRKP